MERVYRIGFSFLLLFCCFFFSACIDEVTLDVQDMLVERAARTADATFATLRESFEDPMLPGDFSKLHALTNTETYLNFLTQAQDAAVPYQTYQDFLEQAEPDPERYLPFLTQFFAEPTAEDVAVIDYLTQAYRSLRVTNYAALHNFNFAAFMTVFTTNIELGEAILRNERVVTWKERRFGEDADERSRFSKELSDFGTEIEKADARRIQTLLDTYGEDDGMIWLAIREPLLLGQILKDFTDTGLFLAWVDGEFFEK